MAVTYKLENAAAAGILANDSCCTDAIRAGERVDFHSDHVIDVHRAPPSCELPFADGVEPFDF
jgi:hypothetical protein